MRQTWADPTFTNNGCAIARCSWETRVKFSPGALGVRIKRKQGWLKTLRCRAKALRTELLVQIFFVFLKKKDALLHKHLNHSGSCFK